MLSINKHSEYPYNRVIRACTGRVPLLSSIHKWCVKSYVCLITGVTWNVVVMIKKLDNNNHFLYPLIWTSSNNNFSSFIKWVREHTHMFSLFLWGFNECARSSSPESALTVNRMRAELNINIIILLSLRAIWEDWIMIIIMFFCIKSSLISSQISW